MATIKEIQADHYRIPLPVALSDSTRGTTTQSLAAAPQSTKRSQKR